MHLPFHLLLHQTPFTRKTRSKKSSFYLGQSEWVDTSTWLLRVPRGYWSSPATLHASVHPNMLLNNHLIGSLFPFFSLALHGRRAVSFMIINTTRQYHMTRGPTWSLTCELLDITTCRLKCCFQTNESHHVDEGESLSIIYVKKKKRREGGFHIGHHNIVQTGLTASFHHILYMWVLKRLMHHLVILQPCSFNL